ncbi:MAG TPA: hypothetical protein PK082_04010 [Phycisphaerae bacterium]|nr:hypothetical protein [Phycisphaerae bacterium]
MPDLEPDTKSHCRSRLALLALAALPMGMLYPLWGNPVSAGEDDVIYYYPLRKMVGEQLRAGRWPLENPREAGGVPLMADPQAAVLYPPTWLFAATDAKLAYSLNDFLAFSVAGTGMFAYLRAVGLGGAGAMFGALAFMFCGFLVGHRVHLSLVHTAAYLPWGLWCVERLRVRAKQAFAAMTPVVLLALLAGHWPTFIHLCLAWGVYLLLRARPLGRAILLAAGAMALAALIAMPQILATRDLLAQATRHRIGYAEFGENSFFPAAGVLAGFPFLFGSRTANLFPQRWWGPWHLCEMLGYVGLATLALAGATVWRLYHRRPGAPGSPDETASLVRVWTWMGAGAGVWMLGYYLPTYKLVHLLPVLGVVRCPARMVLVVDAALAVLAAVGVDRLVRAGTADERAARLARAIRSAVTVALPAAMLIALALVAVLALLGERLGAFWAFFSGTPADALAALWPPGPALWVPAGLAVATIALVRYWLGAPSRRAGWLIVLLLADLFFLTRFVDVPLDRTRPVDPDVSPAGAWLKQHDGDTARYRIWSLADVYQTRQAELLVPKIAQSLGFRTINGYGPFQSPVHAHLLGFRIYGNNRDWRRLVEENRLLSLCGVKYLIAASPEHREVIENVCIAKAPPAEEGENLLVGEWRLSHAVVATAAGSSGESRLRLETPFLWRWSQADQPVTLEPDRVYRIALDARGPMDGAANFLRADVAFRFPDGRCEAPEDFALIAYPEQIGVDWRHFEWTFSAEAGRWPAGGSVETIFRVFTMSERLIEVQNVELRASYWPAPRDSSGLLVGGEHVYLDQTPLGLPPLRPSEPRVHIYRNRLWQKDLQPLIADEQTIERLKWQPGTVTERRPDFSLRARTNPPLDLLRFSLPGACVYLLIVGLVLLPRLRRNRSGEP